MADANTGYILKQQIYTGKNLQNANNRDDVPYVGLAQQVVTDLLRGYENKGYVVVTDNFYSSPTLSLKLKEKEINSLGTVKSSSQNLDGGLVTGEIGAIFLQCHGMIIKGCTFSVLFTTQAMLQVCSKKIKWSEEVNKAW